MVAVVRLTYETMLSALGTYGLSWTQHSHNIQQADIVGDDIIADGEVRRELKRLMGVRATGAERDGGR